MPLNGKTSAVSKPSWLKDAPAPATTAATTPSRPSWTRKTPEAAKKLEEVAESAPKKETSAKLQSREIKVPLKVEKTIKPTPILKKPVEEPAKTPVVDKKPPTKLSASKSPTPVKTPPSKTPSKSPSKTPDPDSEEDSDEDESETETETESDSDEEIDSDLDFSDNEPYRPPSPVNAKQKLVIPALRKVKKSPDQSEPERSQSPEFSFRKPELRKVVTKQKSEIRERTPSPEPKFVKPKLRKVPSSLRTKDFRREKLPVVELKKAPSKQLEFGDSKKSMENFPLKPSILRNESNKKIPLPPPPPPPPPPPGKTPPPDFQKSPISDKQRQIIEKLKTRPRRRPDWSEMMKEVESKKNLRHVQCNDRSNPIVTCKSLAKVKGQYVFETEKKNTALDKLLNEIQSGVRLKPTRTNDRSKPVLEGLRKFRRQMTVEEQIQKSESKACFNTESVPEDATPDEVEDELDDIDRVRDDLQSTKQMLALELRNKEAQERENKRLLAKIANLEAELNREKTTKTESRSGSICGFEVSIPVTTGSGDDTLIRNLKKESEELLRTSKQLEKKYQDAAELLDNANKQIEEQKRLIASLEKKFQGPDFDSRRQSEVNNQKEGSPEMELVLSEEEEDESDEKKAERAARRLKREVDMLNGKLARLKEKEMTARNERKALRDGIKKNQEMLKNEKKKFKKLQKEVEKMAAMMKAVEDEDEDEEAEEKEELEEEEQSEESENESEESESESESETESQSEDEDAEDQRKKENLEPRVKRHDGRLSSLKKGNYLLEASVERIKDEIKEHKEKCGALQADLDSVIDLC